MEENNTPEENVPKIVISDNQVVLDTHTARLVINGEEEQIVMQKLTSGKRRELIKKHLKTSVVGTQVTSNPDMGAYQIGLLEYVIKEAPFEISFKFLESFPEEVIDYLYNQYKKWDKSEKKND